MLTQMMGAGQLLSMRSGACYWKSTRVDLPHLPRAVSAVLLQVTSHAVCGSLPAAWMFLKLHQVHACSFCVWHDIATGHEG
jgi:hypothetical protein